MPTCQSNKSSAQASGTSRNASKRGRKLFLKLNEEQGAMQTDFSFKKWPRYDKSPGREVRAQLSGQETRKGGKSTETPIVLDEDDDNNDEEWAVAFGKLSLRRVTNDCSGLQYAFQKSIKSVLNHHLMVPSS